MVGVSFLLYAYGIGLTCHRRYFTSRSNWSTRTTVGVIVLLCNIPAIPGICVKPEHFTNPNHADPASHLSPFYPLEYNVRYSTTMLNISSLLKDQWNFYPSLLVQLKFISDFFSSVPDSDFCYAGRPCNF